MLVVQVEDVRLPSRPGLSSQHGKRRALFGCQHFLLSLIRLFFILFLFFLELEVYTPLLVQQELAKLLRQNLCVISKGL